MDNDVLRDSMTEAFAGEYAPAALAEVALAALGLDDLDAAVERAARSWFDGEYDAFAWDSPPHSDDLFRHWQGCRSKARIHARTILEATLTPQNGKDARPCSKCDGKGEVHFMNMHPEDYEPPVPCDRCGGSGTVPDGKETL